MSVEITGPVARRSIGTGYRVVGSRCMDCGREYFPAREICGVEGRRSRMEQVNFFNTLGKIVSGSVVRDAPKRFSRISPYITTISSFDGVMVPGRLTDTHPDSLREEFDISFLLDKPVYPVFRRLYENKGGLITYSSLNFVTTDYTPLPPSEPLKEQPLSEISGIVGYGVYVPRFRLRTREIAEKYGRDPKHYEKILGLIEKAVCNLDEDSSTLAVEAGRRALVHSGLHSKDLKEVFVGTESNPYAVKPIAATVVEALDLGGSYDEGYCCGAVDLEFACKAATDVIKSAVALSEYKLSGVPYSMVIGTDNSQAYPGDDLDYSVGAGAAAFIFGKRGVIATVEACESYTSDTPDFYRRDQERYPKHEDRFTGEPAYFKHVVNCAKILMEKKSLKPADLDYIVCHQPNSRFPEKAAQMLGFEEEQYLQGLKVRMIGNTYSGASLIGLASILDVAEPGQLILLVGYGSGAGSDAYLIRVQPPILERRERTQRVDDMISSDQKIFVNYEFYRRSKDYT